MIELKAIVNYEEEQKLELEFGEGITLILGETGAYKTTVLKVIGGVTVIEDGEVVVDDVHLEEVPPSKRNMALVSKDTVPTCRTVKKALMQPLRLRGVKKSEAIEAAKEAARSFGLEPKAKLKGIDLLLLFAARLSLRSPDVTMFDEPYHFLGERAEVTDMIRAQKSKYTIVTSASGEALRMLEPDNLIVMRRGEVLQCGKREEVVSSPVSKYVELLINM